MTLSYSEARQEVIKGLLLAAAAHESGRLALIETEYDSVESILYINNAPESPGLSVALNFWDGWIDARNHDWQYYEGITAEDWPRLARGIAADLEADREITDEVIRGHFDLKLQAREPGIFRRLIGLPHRKR